MKEIWNWVQAALTAFGGFLGWFLGGFDGFLYALVALMVADYITGVMCAIVDKKLSSEIGFRGIFKTVSYTHLQRFWAQSHSLLMLGFNC